jgi:predicted GNAT family acetyltransferase
MDHIQLKLNAKNHGGFYLFADEEQLGEMAVSIADGTMTVFHTEVAPKAEGQGYAKKMLEEMVGYARANQLKVVPLCPYVHAQFKRHPDAFSDIWKHES